MNKLSEAQYNLVYAHIDEAIESHGVDEADRTKATDAVFENIWDNAGWAEIFEEIDDVVSGFAE